MTSLTRGCLIFFFFHFLGDPFFVSAVLDHVSRFSPCFESPLRHGPRYLGYDDVSVQFWWP